MVLNIVVNAFVMGGGLAVLLSPLSRKFLRNGKTPLLQLIRALVGMLTFQGALRMCIELVPGLKNRERPGTASEAIRFLIGLTSFGAILAIAQYLWTVIEDALRDDGARHG